ncbi:MAG: hypothetical protein ACI89L_002132 [Phycisphaerales bacterium]|jgi:hypothetical protein
MLSMNRLALKAAALLTAASLWATPHAAAIQDTPPTIETSSVLRSISTLADWSFDGESDFTQDTHDSTSNGPFIRQMQSDIAHVQGAEASGHASHNSSITAFRILSEATCRSDATGPDTDFYIIGAANVTEFEATFTVPVDATASFSSSFESADSGFPGLVGGSSSVRIEFKGTRADGTAFRFFTFRGSGVSFGPDEYSEVVELKANSELSLSWKLTAVATEGFPGDEFAQGSITCELNLGDADGDGLLDVWEINGIDTNGDGIPEIDLPAMGADPFKKNLFVELDAHAGVPVDATAIAMVEAVFATAPADMVDNPDGSDGIILHVLIDDNDLTAEPYVFSTWPAEFDQQKAARFGPALLRFSPQWESTIKPIYEQIFRYCVWGSDLQSDGSLIAGIAELPGDDFIISATRIHDRYSDEYAHLRTSGLAGVFMHELGHTLNLRHGGQENKNLKPNYLSIMNYLYLFPLRGVTVEGTPRSVVWELDFARTAPRTLNENILRETQGLNGPEGRFIIFNVAADPLRPVSQIADADAPQIDWNLSGQPFETDPVAVNISRLSSNPDSLENALVPFTDWDRIWYHLSGSEDFADGPHLSAVLPDPTAFTIFDDLESFTMHDRSTPSCPADLNGDGIVDLGDISAFIALFLTQSPAADFNNDTIIDLGDIQAFVTLFLEGC